MTVIVAARTTTLPSGERIPALGQGTWHMAEDPRRRADEIAALRLGIELDMTLIDTAEMYADGGAKELVGEAIDGHRDEVFLVSRPAQGKVRPLPPASFHWAASSCLREQFRDTHPAKRHPGAGRLLGEVVRALQSDGTGL